MRTLSLFLLTAAACSAAVTPPEQIQVPPGFKVELLREAGPREGSWICMTQDEQGRLYISPQGAIPESGFGQDSKWGGIWRVTLAPDAAGEAQSSKLKAQDPQPNTGAQPGEIRNPQSAIRNWEKVPVPVGDAMGMLWAFDSLYVSGMGPQGRGIYRCTSSQHDGNFDTATLFKAIPGGAGEHGAHAIVLGPDKKLYIVNGNSTGILDGLAPDSPYRHWGEDDLLPRLKDPVATFFDKLKAPYGCVYRTDADGTKWELFAGGFRNPYDIAFNADGELFTYDSDMEWDRGLPWYRPTRILHVVPGGEYGFREGSAKWPAYFPDSLPAAADIGVGCPTGMTFGTGAKGWPEKYRRALFFHDWTYGRILAVTLHEKGASYTARNDLASHTYPRDAEANHDVEVFLSGKGMPVTDLEFLRDGSMVFTVGGRGTAAALYRVSHLEKGAASANDVPRGRVGVPPAVPGVPPGTADVADATPRENPSAKEPASTPDASRGTRDAAGGTPTLPARNTGAAADATQSPSAIGNAPEAPRKSAGGAASEAGATTGSPSAKASAPDGARENAGAQPEPIPLEKIGSVISDVEKSLSPDQLDNRAFIDALVKAGVDSQTMAEVAKIIRGKKSVISHPPRMDDLEGQQRVYRIGGIARAIMDLNLQFLRFQQHTETSGKFPVETAVWGVESATKMVTENPGLRFEKIILESGALMIAQQGSANDQAALLRGLKHAPLTQLDEFWKMWKLRVLEVSFARQGRPSEERVKAVMEELLAHYPAGGAGGGTRPPGALGQASPPPKTRPEVAFHPGAQVNDPAWRLNRELCALLVWLSNPELGALNADLAGKKADKPKTGGIQIEHARLARLSGPKPTSEMSNGGKNEMEATETFGSGQNLRISRTGIFGLGKILSFRASEISELAKFSDLGHREFSWSAKSVDFWHSNFGSWQKNVFLATWNFHGWQNNAFSAADHFNSEQKNVFLDIENFGSGQKNVFPATADFGSRQNNDFPATVDVGSGQNTTFPAISDSESARTDVRITSAAPNEAPPDVQKGAETAKKAPELPSEGPPTPGAARPPLNSQSSTLNPPPNSGLGPVANPGADIFPGRQPAPFQTELGRQVIEKTLALMDAAPSQEEQIWYALCLRWAHGWTPEQRGRYFRWFHEKAARYSGGNSFAKFVEAIRADAAVRLPASLREALQAGVPVPPEYAALAQWMRPVAAPAPAAALKPRAFVKAWTLPELGPRSTS